MTPKRNRQKKMNKKSSEMILLRHVDPPQYNPPVLINNTFRFKSTIAAVATVTLDSMMASLGTVCFVANLTGSVDADALKINSISIWGPPTAGSRIELGWSNANTPFVRPTFVSDVCNSTSVPAYVSCRPPKNELFSGWLSPNSAATTLALFTTNCPVGCYLDLNVTYMQYSGATASTQAVYTYGSGAASLGSRYYVYLDGAAHNWAPVDLQPNF